MTWLNTLLGGLVAGLLFPFRGLPPIVGLAAVSLACSVLILLVYRVASDQAALRQVKGRILAAILEIRLFRDDLRTILAAQLDILRHSLTYLRLSLAPMLWAIVPIVLLLIQLQFHYGYDGLRPGEQAIVKAHLREGSGPLESGSKADIELSAPEGVVVATPTLFVPAQREVDWRIAVETEGDYELVVAAGGSRVTKTLRASGGLARRSPRRPSAGLLDRLLYPVEPPVPADGPIEAVEITYPAARVSLLGWRTHWMVAFFILTVLFAFALQRPLRVTI